MKLYSYVLNHDTGFAPNPYWDYCTLACCKPDIRKKTEKGDWIMGTFPKRYGPRKLSYLMMVDECLPREKYYEDVRFQTKKPTKQAPCGDNIYYKDGIVWKQHPNAIFHKRKKDIFRDLKVNKVCIGHTFYYFGGSGPELDSRFWCGIKKGPFHKVIEDEALIQELVEWVKSQPKGKMRKIGEPRDPLVIGGKKCGC